MTYSILDTSNKDLTWSLSCEHKGFWDVITELSEIDDKVSSFWKFI